MLKTINSDGSLKISLIGSAVPAGAIYNGGLAYAPDGSLYVKLTQGALSGQTYNGGLACTPDGALYVANSTPAASATFRRGLLCRADGAIHVSDATVATVRHDGGVPKDNAGRLFVGIPLAGLAAAFDARIGITQAGGFVSQWNDISGNSRHLKQTTGANQPAYDNTGGIPSLLFDGAAHWMRTGAFTLNQPETVFIVFKPLGFTSGDRVVDGVGVNTGRINQNTATPRLDIYAGATGVLFDGPTSGVRGVICAKFNGANSSARYNLNSAVSGDVGASNMGGLTVGADGTASPSTFSNIQAYEALIYSAALDDGTCANIIRALMSKHGVV